MTDQQGLLVTETSLTACRLSPTWLHWLQSPILSAVLSRELEEQCGEEDI